ncbi:MAG: M1 family metallopeptidase [Bacteroidia bacterium]|nr:M1 family metallopeptidase [Bacteroidia bacterium]
MFQQEVNFEIHVKLDDVHHILRGYEKIEYINNSDSTLNFIYFHLWPNAYRHANTALGRQFFKQENYVMMNLTDDSRGWIDSLDFVSDNKSLKTEAHPLWEDVIKVYLNSPLKPKDTILITTPFRVKIPSAGISRLGHYHQSYHITQWYPKPAVFDYQGWHPMPYLDQGEFYSEFGTYDVFITLPENYMVGATGVLIQPEEEVDRINERILESIDFIDKGKEKYSIDFPPSSPRLKTLHFRQYRVHDFAWFADKRYYVLHDVVVLPESGREVDTWIFFLKKDALYWKDALNYLNRSLLFYSKEVGEYPYNQITAVSGEMAAGGGMEYPCITVISPVSNSMQLDIVITHEVGHNWFYGILATNERLYPGMDEGINSFYESKYVEAFYPDKSINDYLDLGLPSFTGADKIHLSRGHLYAYLLSARNNLGQPISTRADLFSKFNYGNIVYSKTAQIFKMLENFMGEATFRTAMQFYFDKYKFTHPSPISLLKTLQFFSGSDLKWFFDYFINSDIKLDLSLIKIKTNPNFSYQLLVKNRKAIPTPFSVSAFRKDGIIIGTVCKNPSKYNTDTIFFPPCKADFFVLDAEAVLPELYRHNNVLYVNKKIFKRNLRPKLNFLTSIPDNKRTTFYYFPLAGYNFNDGIMTGMLLHNYDLLPKPFEFFIAPLFGWKSKDLSGLGNMQYSFYPEGKTRIFRIGLNTKKFSLYAPNISKKRHYYLRNSLDLLWERKPSDYTLKIRWQAGASAIHLFDKNNFLIAAQKDTHRIFLRYFISREDRHSWSPEKLTFMQTLNRKFIRTECEYLKSIPLNERYHFNLRFFCGLFFDLGKEPSYYAMFSAWGQNAQRDYTCDGFFFGRPLGNVWTENQFRENDGGMKVRSALGSYTRHIFSFTFESPSFGKLPLYAFADAAVVDQQTIIRHSLLWDTGIAFKIKELALSVYFPILYSRDIQENLKLNDITFWRTIRFSINFESFKFREIVNANLLN